MPTSVRPAHPSRLASVSQHLPGDAIDPAHVFLKVEAFKLDAPISVINDLDMLVLNEEKLADLLQLKKAAHTKIGIVWQRGCDASH